MAPTPNNGNNKGKVVKAESSNPKLRRPTHIREIPPRVRNNLLRFCPRQRLEEWLASTKPQQCNFLDYILDLDRQAFGHCKCCSKSQPNTKPSKSTKAPLKPVQKRTCPTCNKQGNKRAIPRCGRCRQWFHPTCELEEPNQLYVTSQLPCWYCEDCQGRIDTRDVSDEDDDDEKYPASDDDSRDSEEGNNDNFEE